LSALSRRGLLAGALSAGLLGVRGARGVSGAPHLFVIVANGGWDPTFVLDPIPAGPGGPHPDLDPEDPDDVELEAQYGEIVLTTNAARRPGVNAFFDTFGARTTVVNGLWAGTLSHWDAMRKLLTGTSDAGAADLVALTGARSGQDWPLPALDASGVGRPGPLSDAVGRTGVRGQLSALLTPEVRYPLHDGGPRPDAGLQEPDWDSIAAFHAARGTGGARETAQARADALAARAAEVGSLFPPGRRRELRDDLEMVVSLVESGVCHSALLDSGQHWDSHANAWRQHASFDGLFWGLKYLGELLTERALLDRSLVVVVSEIGRTPVRNAQNGTDHWPYTSALLFGADVAGGRLLGGCDAERVGLPCDPETGRPISAGDPLTFPNLVAGVLEAMGIEGMLAGVRSLRGFRA
jgi:hypothetical protein